MFSVGACVGIGLRDDAMYLVMLALQFSLLVICHAFTTGIEISSQPIISKIDDDNMSFGF